MKDFFQSRVFFPLLVVLLTGGPAFAGGPLVVSDTGDFFVWDSPVIWNPDPGGLGALSNIQADQLTFQAFNAWQSVATATISFRQGADLAQDLTRANFGSILNAPCNRDVGNPIAYDTDGSIVDAIFGTNQRFSIIGFAGPDCITTAAPFRITRGSTLINGLFIDGVGPPASPSDFTQQEILASFVHQFGHMINLDHSQSNQALVGDRDRANDRSVPTMFPIAFDDQTQKATLNRDDIAWVSRLYPSASFGAQVKKTPGRPELDAGETTPKKALSLRDEAVENLPTGSLRGDEGLQEFGSLRDDTPLPTGALRPHEGQLLTGAPPEEAEGQPTEIVRGEGESITSGSLRADDWSLPTGSLRDEFGNTPASSPITPPPVILHDR